MTARHATLALFLALPLAGCGPEITLVIGGDYGETDGSTGDDIGESGGSSDTGGSIDMGDVTGGQTTGDIVGGDGDGDGDNCEPAPNGALVTDDGSRLWAWLAVWSVRAEYADPDTVNALLDAGEIGHTLAEFDTSAACYDVSGSGDHLCVTTAANCVPLRGEPVIDLVLSSSQCGPGWPWDSTGIYFGSERCRGVIDGVAVLLDAE